MSNTGLIAVRLFVVYEGRLLLYGNTAKKYNIADSYMVLKTEKGAVMDKYQILLVMILATSGQHSCNTRTSVPETSGQPFLNYPDRHS